MIRLLLLSFLLSTSSEVFAYMELNLKYSFAMRRVDGVQEVGSEEDPGAAVTTTEGYGVNLAWYMWEYTAIELNYSEYNERLEDTRKVTDDSITIVKIDSLVNTKVTGAGIKQRFASRKSAIIPAIALGYAKYTTSGEVNYDYTDTGGNEYEISVLQKAQVFNSSYAELSLLFRFTNLLGLTLSAKTIMPDFDTDKASDNVTYAAGLSWIF